MAYDFPVCKCRYAAGVCPRWGWGVAPVPACTCAHGAAAPAPLEQVNGHNTLLFATRLLPCCRAVALAATRKRAGRWAKTCPCCRCCRIFHNTVTLTPSLCTTPPSTYPLTLKQSFLENRATGQQTGYLWCFTCENMCCHGRQQVGNRATNWQGWNASQHKSGAGFAPAPLLPPRLACQLVAMPSRRSGTPTPCRCRIRARAVCQRPAIPPCCRE